jgi:hypothetical protein
MSFVQGDCGTELALNCISVGRLNALEWLLPCDKSLIESFQYMKNLKFKIR